MRLYVAVTDPDWFRHVRDAAPVEINFWMPRDTRRFLSLSPNELFLFKLRGDREARVVGGGYFIEKINMPAYMAWEAFGADNGCARRDDFFHRLRSLGGDEENLEEREIGCVLLAEPFALPEPIALPDWAPNIVQGRGYDLSSERGAALWSAVRAQLETVAEFTGSQAARVEEIRAGYGPPALAARRRGQGAFRLLTIEKYHRRCCITGEHTLPALEAAHIVPFAAGGDHRASNGLCLRADLHRLFDRGLLAVDERRRARVSSRIAELFLNGDVYYRLEGRELVSLPDRPEDRPDPEALRFHRERVFRP